MRIQRIPERVIADNLEVASIDLGLLSNLIDKYKNKKGNLIPLLQGAQDIYGYIPEKVFRFLAAETGISLSDM